MRLVEDENTEKGEQQVNIAKLERENLLRGRNGGCQVRCSIGGQLVVDEGPWIQECSRDASETIMVG